MLYQRGAMEEALLACGIVRKLRSNTGLLLAEGLPSYSLSESFVSCCFQVYEICVYQVVVTV